MGYGNVERKINKNRRLYVAYGSNLNIKQMELRCPTAALKTTGIIKDYELRFCGHPNSAFLSIAPHKGSIVPVAVWEIGLRDEFSLDMYEGYPRYYKKDVVTVDVKDESIEVFTYIMADSKHLDIPSQGYYDIVYEGYKDMNFDINILNEAVNRSIEHSSQYEEFSLFDEEISDDDMCL